MDARAVWGGNNAASACQEGRQARAQGHGAERLPVGEIRVGESLQGPPRGSQPVAAGEEAQVGKVRSKEEPDAVDRDVVLLEWRLWVSAACGNQGPRLRAQCEVPLRGELLVRAHDDAARDARSSAQGIHALAHGTNSQAIGQFEQVTGLFCGYADTLQCITIRCRRREWVSATFDNQRSSEPQLKCRSDTTRSAGCRTGTASWSM